jgi:hypothetical protein
MYKRILPATILLLLTAVAQAGESANKKNYSPYAGMDYPKTVYWGDTHVHTTRSPDAYSLGTTLTQADAYRFARGESVTSNSGQTVRLSRPLDFLLASDHAEFMGAFTLLGRQDPAFLKSEVGKRWNKMYSEKKYREVFIEFTETLNGQRHYEYDSAIRQSVWQDVIDTAEQFNQPGKFTALIGFEWSSMPEGGNNLHRNVIFRDDADKAQQVIPFSALDSPNPEDLWRYMAEYETLTQGKVLAIPHNGNLSNGMMFYDKTFNGQPLTKDYAETRIRWEPLIEATQIKGDSEAHSYLSPDDEFANYETWDASNLGSAQRPKEPWMLKHEYMRSALKLGLGIEQALRANPYKFGVVGSSDSHTGMAAIEENNFFGKFGREEPSKERIYSKMEVLEVKTYAATGFAAVWATENTRKALFDAMQRKETYATTGPRMLVRFFGGWDFAENDHLRPDYDLIGYRKGVPMGGDLYKAANKNSAPQFMVVASKDPMGANLDRVQIVKGWLNADGSTAEKVYNVVVSDNRKVKKNKVKALESTVDIATATYTNTVGEVQLSTVWTDPDFNPEQRAFYYVRVLEILTPRWTTYDAAFYDIAPPEAVPAQQQERAYTSPIWYTPAQL